MIFTFKTPKKTYLSSKRFMVSGWFRVSDKFFMFLEVMDWFNKVRKVFWIKNGLKMSFWIRKRTLFSRPNKWLDSKINKRHVVYFLSQPTGVGNESSTLLNFLKIKSLCASLFFIEPGQVVPSFIFIFNFFYINGFLCVFF